MAQSWPNFDFMMSQGLLNFQILGIYGDLKNAFGQNQVGQTKLMVCNKKRFIFYN